MGRYHTEDREESQLKRDPDMDFSSGGGWQPTLEEIHHQGDRIDRQLDDLEKRLDHILLINDPSETRTKENENTRCRLITDMNSVVSRLQAFGDRIQSLTARVDI